MSFHEIISQVQGFADTSDLKGYPHRLGIVNNGIWIPSNTKALSYEVFNISTKTLTPKTCELKCVMSVCQTHTGHVIAACDNGLFALDTGGSLKYKLSDDSFTDVCTSGENIFAIKTKFVKYRCMD